MRHFVEYITSPYTISVLVLMAVLLCAGVHLMLASAERHDERLREAKRAGREEERYV